MNQPTAIPEKVRNFVEAAEHLRLKSEKLRKHFMKNFPNSHYRRVPKIRQDMDFVGMWEDPDTRLGLLIRKNGQHELF